MQSLPPVYCRFPHPTTGFLSSPVEPCAHPMRPNIPACPTDTRMLPLLQAQGFGQKQHDSREAALHKGAVHWARMNGLGGGAGGGGAGGGGAGGGGLGGGGEGGGGLRLRVRGGI